MDHVTPPLLVSPECLLTVMAINPYRSLSTDPGLPLLDIVARATDVRPNPMRPREVVSGGVELEVERSTDHNDSSSDSSSISVSGQDLWSVVTIDFSVIAIFGSLILSRLVNFFLVSFF